MKNDYEIERKFLIDKLDSNLSVISIHEIEQGYLSFNNPEIRIRKCDDKFYLTSKGHGTLKRVEKEKEISINVYNTLKEFVISKYIKKTRTLIRLDNDIMAEVDFYKDSLDGLKVVEVEFDSLEKAEAFKVPNWFGVEVTEDEKYRNHYLAILN